MTRRLAAILAADVIGYSKLMSEDQDGTLAALRRLRSEVFAPAVASIAAVVKAAAHSLEVMQSILMVQVEALLRSGIIET